MRQWMQGPVTDGTLTDVAIKAVRGTVAFDRAAYRPGDVVRFSIWDKRANTNPGHIETVPVLLASSAEPVGERILAYEMGKDSQLFTGSVRLRVGRPSAMVSFRQACATGYLPRMRPVGIPKRTPQISTAARRSSSSIAVADITANSAFVSWDTDEPTRGIVHMVSPEMLVQLRTMIAFGRTMRLCSAGFGVRASTISRSWPWTGLGMRP